MIANTTTPPRPEFFEKLIAVAEARPDAAAIYADCQWHGGRSDLEIAPSIEGDTLARLRQFIEQKEPVAVRGLIRRDAIAQAGLVRSDEFRALSEIFVWLAKVLRWGSFVRVPEPLYYRLNHADNYHKQWFDWPDERKRASWTTMFTGWLEAVVPACSSPEERLFFEHFILDRISVQSPGRPITTRRSPRTKAASSSLNVSSGCHARAISTAGSCPKRSLAIRHGRCAERWTDYFARMKRACGRMKRLPQKTPCSAALARSRSHAQSAACWAFRM